MFYNNVEEITMKFVQTMAETFGKDITGLCEYSAKMGYDANFIFLVDLRIHFCVWTMRFCY